MQPEPTALTSSHSKRAEQTFHVGSGTLGGHDARTEQRSEVYQRVTHAASKRARVTGNYRGL